MTMALFSILAVASDGLAPSDIHFLMAGAFRLVSLFSGLYQPSLCRCSVTVSADYSIPSGPDRSYCQFSV